MPLTDEDRNELRDILTTARLHHWEIISVGSAMIERMLDEPPPMINQIDVRLEAVADRLEEVCDKSALGAWNELERLRKDFAQETERAEKAEAELERLKALLKRYEANAEKSQCWPQPAPSCNPSWPS